jgi:hypothetical protein
MSILWLIPIFAAIAFVAWYLPKRKAAKKAKQFPQILSVDIPAICYEPESNHHTPGGVVVRSYIPVGPEVLQLIENGIAHTLRNTASQNWANFRNLSDFQVFLVPPATHNVEDDPGSPALLVKSLDPNGVDIRTTQAAGTCMGVPGGILRGDDVRYPSIILPYEDSELPAHAQYFEESARNEAEHIVMWANNRAMFFNYVGANDQHPIFPDA